MKNKLLVGLTMLLIVLLSTNVIFSQDLLRERPDLTKNTENEYISLSEKNDL